MRQVKTAAFLALAAGLAIGAKGSDLSWLNGAGGAASTAGNWSPSLVPGAADDLLFNIPGSYGVTFNASVPQTNTHTYRQGTVSVTAAVPHTATGGINVAENTGDVATMTLASGTLTSGVLMVISNSGGSTGTVNVNSNNSDLLVGGNMFVGNAGTGNLNVTNLGHVQVSSNFLAGTSSTAIGNTTVSGFSVAPINNSFLEVLGSGESRLGQLGDANLTVSSGALASFAGSLVVGQLSTASSTVTLQTAGLFPARLSVAGDMLVGRNNSGLTAGVGTVNVNGGGSATVGGSLLVAGDPEGGTGTLNINGNGIVTATNVTIGAGGVLHHNDGTLKINGGQFTQGTAPLNVSSTTGTATMVFQNGAQASLISNGNPNFRALTIGGPGASADGLMQVESGSHVFLLSPANPIIAVIAENADDRGELEVDGAGSFFGSGIASATSQLTVGADGVGRAEVTNGGKISIGVVNVGAGANSISTMFVQDPGSILEVTKDLAVGGTTAGVGGFGDLFVRNGGLLTVTDNTVSTLVYQQGGISVDNATFNSAGIVDVFGGFLGVAAGGVVNAGEVRIDDGQVGGDGQMNTRVRLFNGALLTCGSIVSPSVPQTLVVGDATSAAGFTSSGSSIIQIRDNSSLTIRDLNRADAERIDMFTGSITAPNGIRLLSTANVIGNGLIDADVDFNSGGTINPDATGLRFGGTLTRSGGTIAGGVIGFNSGGGYTGDGTVASNVDADAGSVITATGALTMGLAGSNFGVLIDGTLHCGSHPVNLLDANGIGLGFMTDIAGGSLSCAQNLTVNAGKVIEGVGGITTPTLTVNGFLVPGDTQADGPGTGQIHLFGNLTFQVNGHYKVELAPFNDLPQHDRTIVSQTATITGDVIVGLVPSYTPNPRDTFDIVISGSVVGKFATQTLPNMGAFGPAHIVYSPTRVTVVMCYANCDGSGTTPVLNANDFQCFLNKFAANESYANCDGSSVAPVLNANDFQCFLNKFAGGCP